MITKLIYYFVFLELVHNLINIYENIFDKKTKEQVKNIKMSFDSIESMQESKNNIFSQMGKLGKIYGMLWWVWAIAGIFLGGIIKGIFITKITISLLPIAELIFNGKNKISVFITCQIISIAMDCLMIYEFHSMGY